MKRILLLSGLALLLLTCGCVRPPPPDNGHDSGAYHHEPRHNPPVRHEPHHAPAYDPQHHRNTPQHHDQPAAHNPQHRDAANAGKGVAHAPQRHDDAKRHVTDIHRP